MSLRGRIILVFGLSIGLALLTSALALVHLRNVERMLNELALKELDAVRLEEQIRTGLVAAEHARDTLTTLGDREASGRCLAEIHRVQELCSRGARSSPEAAYGQLCRDVEGYRGTVEQLSRTVAEELDALAQLGRKVERARDRMVRRSETFERSLLLTAKATGKPSDALLAARLETLREHLERLTDAVSAPPSATLRLRAVRPDFARASLEAKERLAALSEQARGTLGNVLPLERFRSAVGGLLDALQVLDRRRDRLAAELMLSESSIEERVTRLRTGLDDLRKRSTTRLAASRRDVANSTRWAGGLILLLLLGGGGAVLALVVRLAMRSSRGLGRLSATARMLHAGDLDARVDVEGTDELAALAASLNEMAAQLQFRGLRRNAYNEIVTLLVGSVGRSELLPRALSAIMDYLGSPVGAVYLREEDGDRLLPAECIGLSDAQRAALKPVQLGDGVVGRAAGEGRAMVLADLPPEGLHLDVGVAEITPSHVLVLPIPFRERVLGAMVLTGFANTPQEELDFLQGLMVQVGVALDVTRAYYTIEQSAVQLKAKTVTLAEQSRSLKALNIELQEASRLKNEFLANISHELRTPLNSIIGFTELVLEKTELPERRERNLLTVLRNARHLLELIEDLLDLSRIEAGRMVIRPEEFDLAELVEHCLGSIQPLLDNRPVRLLTELANDLPPMHSDRGKVRRILLNLLANAAKFTTDGHIRVSGRREGEHIRLDVEDTGIGIPQAEHERVFHPFQQVDGSAARRRGGAGLGLAITRQLCSLLGGTIRLASAPQEGSTFTVVLPVTYTGEPSEVATRTPLPAPQRQRRRVLVFDENPQSVILLRETLSDEGYEVVSAFTLDEASVMVERLKPHAVVLDPWRPDKAGDELLRLLEEKDGGSTRVVGLTLDELGQRGAVLLHGAEPRSQDATLLETLERPGAGEEARRMLAAQGLEREAIQERILTLFEELLGDAAAAPKTQDADGRPV